MNRNRFLLIISVAISATLASSCCTKTTWGTCVKTSTCKPVIRYQGNSFDIGEASIPISGSTITIKGVKWDTKTLQTAASISQAMDLNRIRQCQQLNSAISTLSYADYAAERSRMLKNQEKLDQLAYLVALNNPAAVEKWIDAYSGGFAATESAGPQLGGGAYPENRPAVEVTKLTDR